MSGNEGYHPLLNDKESYDDDVLPAPQPRLRRRHRIFPISFGSSFIIIILAALNLFQFLGINHGNESSQECRSEFAELTERTDYINWDQQSVFASSNNTIADTAWDNLNHDSGVVAVPKDWARAKGLSMGSEFPWDDSKTIYVVNAYHSLHCLKTIYRSFMEYRDSRPQSLEQHHVVHCLDQLRSDVLCVADDTLRVTTSDSSPTTAVGQKRFCRSWDALERWTLDHPGCYRFGNPGVEDAKKSQIPRMRFCPEGSAELQRVREYFGENESWVPTDEPLWSWMADRESKE